MRIVAGKYRGTHLAEFSFDTTKPTLDRVRVAIGNILQFDFTNAVVLDLFSGSGWFGLEALSRGAERVYCVDSNKQAVNLIKQNFNKLRQDTQQIHHSDYMEFLHKAKTIGIKFDIVFLDPPYQTDYAQKATEYILSNNMLNDNGIIMRESDSDSMPLILGEKYEIKSRTYGTPRLEWVRI